MGGKKRKNQYRRDREDNDGNKGGYHRSESMVNFSLTHNEKLEKFYRAQGFIADDEWDAFVGAMAAPLPACFRVHPSYTFAPSLDQQLKDFSGEKVTLQDGTTIDAVSELSWCPLGYKLGIDRKTLRKVRDNSKMAQLHNWLTTNTNAGHITRQEAVSMIPPLALNVEPHHRVLDMCASPGSKTSQLLEIVGKSMYGPVEQQGLVVANDKDAKRAYMLVHQCRRATTPALLVTTHSGQDFPVLNSSAIQPFAGPVDVKAETEEEAVVEGGREEALPPTFTTTTSFTNSRGVVMTTRNANVEPYFDRTLCDVPCAGDGTIRKNQILWKRWRVLDSVALHPTQIAIAKRGIQVTKPGGLIVYSTCSMSPYEDEAVVAELLRSHKGCLELVDARQFVPNFKTRAGLSKWHVLDDVSLGPVDAEGNMVREVTVEKKRQKTEGEDNGGEQEEKGETTRLSAPPVDAPSCGDHLQDAVNLGFVHYPAFAHVPDRRQRIFRESLFPPSEEERSWMNLHYCLRCVPHDEDSGGFFVATLRKTAQPRSTEMDKRKHEKVEEGVTSSGQKTSVDGGEDIKTEKNAEETLADVDKAEKPLGQQFVSYTPISQALHKRLADFYNFKSMLAPEHQCLYVRHDNSQATQPASEKGMASRIYYVPRVMGTNGCLQADAYRRLKLVQAGCQVLALRKGVDRRKDFDVHGQCEYRISQDAVNTVAPFMGHKRIAKLSMADFIVLLKGGIVPVAGLSEAAGVRLKEIGLGAVIAAHDFSYLAPGAPASAVPVTHTFRAVCWANNENFIHVMVTKADLEEMCFTLQGLGVPGIPDDHVQGVQQKKTGTL